MERATFCEHYQITNQYNGSPTELGRFGPAVIYKASDLRSGAPVALTLLPIASVDPAARPRLEEHLRVAAELDHANIAKVVAVGGTEDELAFVSEYPQAETLETWVAAHGPMPADAVLGVALQVMSALAAVRFVALTYPAIGPSNLIIVSGQTAEGGWPSVKILNFGLAGLELATEDRQKDDLPSEFASPEQLQRGTTDFRSAIYSLGATMCYLLTGAFYSAEPRSRQTRRFARPLRNLITPMLRQNPDERPQDPLLFTQAVQRCLQKVERRQALTRTLGIPFVAVKAGRVRHRPKPAPVPLEAEIGHAPIAPLPVTGRSRPNFFGRAVAVAALLLVLATAAAFLLPAPVGMILHRNRDKEIGVPVGIPESSAMAMAQNSSSATTPMSSPPVVPSVARQVPSPTSPAPVESKVVANAARAVSPAQTTSQPAPVSSPVVASVAAVANSPVSQTPAVVSQPTASAQQSGPAFVEDAQSRGAGVSPSPSGPIAAADSPTKPAAPAEGAETVWEQEGGVKQKIATQRAAGEGDAASASATADAGEKTTKRSSAASSKSRPKPKEVASNTRRSGATRYDRSRSEQVPMATDEEDQYQPPYQPYRGDQLPPRVRRALPVPEGSFRARVVGITPGGNLILRLPSGEIAIVPRHRPRRVIIERPYFAPPPRPDFAPPFPPDA